MVVASNLDGVSNAIEASPSDTSLRSLDAVNLLLAGALSGFGPYVAVFLAEQRWTQQNIGFVLTAAGFAGLLTQLPSGGLLDASGRSGARWRGCHHGGSRRAHHCGLAKFPSGVGRPGAPRDHRRVPGAGDRRHQPWPGRPCCAGRTPRT